MPELPEVETIVRGLNRRVVGLKITGAWTDPVKPVKTGQEASWTEIAKDIKGRRILRAHRRAKYIMMDLSGGPSTKLRTGKTLIIHQKISGHLLYGKWKVSGKKIEPAVSGPIKTDPFNRFIRFILYLNK